jgi:hypothetical protein
VRRADERDGVLGLEVESEQGLDIRRDLARAIVSSQWGLLELRPLRMSLEEIFLSLTTEDVSTDTGGAGPPPAGGTGVPAGEPGVNAAGTDNPEVGHE